MKQDTYDLIFDFLIKKTKSSETFSIKELGSYINKKESTAKTYLSKKLMRVYVEKIGRDKFKPINLDYLTKNSFHKYMSQISNDVIDQKKQIHERLKDRSIDSFFLSIELYNRITQTNKNEAFCIFIINAWELILKSYLSKSNGINNIYYSDTSRTLSIGDCIKKVFPNEKDFVRKNLERIIELRDKAIHLLIPELSFDISRLFQSCVINYLDFLLNKFNDNLLYRLNPGFIALIVDQMNKPDFKNLSVKYGEKASSELKSFLTRFKKDEKKYSDIKFAIPIEYKLVLTKKSDESDIQLNTSSSGENKGIFVKVAKDIDISHPFSRNFLCSELNKKFLEKNFKKITTWDTDAMIFKNKVKNSKHSQFHYHLESPSIHRYSEAFLEYLHEKILNDSGYVERCRDSYRHYLKAKRKK